MIKKFLSYYKPYKFMLTCDLIASFIYSVIGIFYPIITRKVFSEFVPDKQERMIIIYGIILLVLYIIRALLRVYISIEGHMIGVHMQKDMREEAFLHIEDLPVSYFDENETGKILSKITHDLFEISELAHHGPENLFIGVFLLLASFVYLFSINFLLALILLVCIPILVIICLYLQNKEAKAFDDAKSNLALIDSTIETSISGIRVTKAFNNKEKEIEKFRKSNISFLTAKKDAYKWMSIYHSTTKFVIDFFNVICIIVGGILALKNIIHVEDYMAFAVAVTMFNTPLTAIIDFNEVYQEGVAGFKRYIKLISEPIEKSKENAIENISLKGNIRFDHVSFSYETKDDVLNDVSFNINSSDTIALVGKTGGGKTTICHLIPRFYEISKGTITFDNIDIKDLSLKALRENIGIVAQDVFLFNGTIKENVLYGKLNATEKEFNDALINANIYDFVQSLPEKENTNIGERGIKLSGGQKQRLSIARVFLKNPPILILDEATSALDNTTEKQIQEALDKLSKGRTTIIVAHRLSTIKKATKIFIVNDGKIKESGTHQELLNQNGEYAALYKSQFDEN